MGAQLNGAICGHNSAPIQEVTLQQAADQGGVADFKQNVLGAQGEGGVFLGIGQDLFHFLQAGGRHHEGQGAAGGIFRMPGAAGQAEAVHSDGGNGIFLHFKFDTGMDGAALVLGHGKNGAADQLLQLVLRDLDGTAGVDVGQLGIVLGGLGGDGKGGVTGPDGHLVVVIHHDGDGTLRQAADNITKEAGRQDALTGFGHISLQGVGDAGFHIVAGEAHAVAGPAQDAFDHSQAALLSDRPAGNCQARGQHIFFTGKTHTRGSFLLYYL